MLQIRVLEVQVVCRAMRVLGTQSAGGQVHTWAWNSEIRLCGELVPMLLKPGNDGRGKSGYITQPGKHLPQGGPPLVLWDLGRKFWMFISTTQSSGLGEQLKFLAG